MNIKTTRLTSLKPHEELEHSQKQLNFDLTKDAVCATGISA